MKQNYKNHRKFYAPHHFILLPALLVLLGYTLWNGFSNSQNQLVWRLFALSTFLILYAVVMMRQHYALGNQNRIIKLEFRQRYHELFNKPSDATINRLSFDQIAALRFAEDEEFKILLDRAVNEKLSGNDIKKAITTWRADHDRV